MDGGNGVSTPIKDVEGLTEELSQINNNISSIKSELVKTNQFTEISTREIKSQINTIFSTIDRIQKSIDNVSAQCSREIQSMSFLNEEAKKVIVQQYQGIQERLEGVNDRLEGNRQDLRGIRERDLKVLASESTVSKIQIDLEDVRTKVNELPTLENIKKQLLDKNSGLANKTDLHKTSNEVHFLKGMMAVNIVATIATFATLFIVSHNAFKQIGSEQSETSPYMNNISHPN
jgi:uncharacterized coiled-coil DUF342 family protein